jgi:carboxylesterase type B
MGKKAISIQPEKVDELNCLNLNIWASVQAKGSAIINKKNLPVLVWVHGGSYQVGAGGVNLYGKI